MRPRGPAARSCLRSRLPLVIAAAASLAPVFAELAPEFERQHGMAVEFSFGSTANLAQQLRNGAPFDALAAADARHIDALIEEARLDPASRTDFAHGRPALAWTPEAEAEPSSLDDLLGNSLPVALANPEFAPCGLAARQALERSGLWGRLQPRLTYAESVRDAGQPVLSGHAQAGLLDTAANLPLVLPPTRLGYYRLTALGARSPLGVLLESLGLPLVFTWRGAAAVLLLLALRVRGRSLAGEMQKG